MTAHSSHDTRIVIDGDVYWVRRDFDLIRRVEQAFGPLGDLREKLRRCALTAEDLVRLTVVALKSQASRPPDDDIREHVANAGIVESSEQLELLVMHLFAGHTRTVAWLEAEAKREAETREEAGGGAAENPSTAPSTGTRTSRRRRTSVGRPATSGAPPITI